MLNEIQSTLNDFSKRDSRLNYCWLDAVSLKKNQCKLSGTILDAAALAEVVAKLQEQYPAASFDTSEVAVLSKPEKKLLTVATNVTNLMREASWITEQMSQVMGGWQVEVLFEQDGWAFVRQLRDGGYLGWVYRNYLTEAAPPATTHMVYAPISLLYAQADESSPLVGQVLAGMEVGITAVSNEWAQLTLADGLTGWVSQKELCALDALPQTEAEQRQQITVAACRLMGVPYSWGGRTALGIDCSGLTELVYRMVGVAIPRDADMQFAAGTEVMEPFKAGDLLFFGSEKGHRSVSHVAVSLGGWHIVHASRSRNGVYVDDVQTVAHLKNTFLGTRSFLP